MAEAQALDGELVVVEPQTVQLGNLRGRSPLEVVASATELANVLRDIINQRGLYKRIGQKDHVYAEGWTTAANLCGLIPREIECLKMETGEYVAVVALVRITDGRELTRASAECGGEGDEEWQRRPAFARRSMSITRATGKVCRISLSWIMNLAGFSPTPYEEMQDVERQERERGLEAARKPPVAHDPRPAKREKRDLPPRSAEMEQDRTVEATYDEDGDTALPPWWEEKLPSGKHKGRTWREMSEGSLGGERHQYMEWVSRAETKNEAQEQTQMRAKYVLRGYVRREAGEGAF